MIHLPSRADQIDQLWNSLACDADGPNDLLAWLHHQVSDKDLHALNTDAYAHIFYNKIPRLSPAAMTITGLKLYQHLYHVVQKLRQQVRLD